MVTFSEKTLAEQGFGVSWNRYVGPALEVTMRQIRRRTVFAVVTSLLALVLAAVAIVMHASVNDAMILAQPFNLALIHAVLTTSLAHLNDLNRCRDQRADFVGNQGIHQNHLSVIDPIECVQRK